MLQSRGKFAAVTGNISYMTVALHLTNGVPFVILYCDTQVDANECFSAQWEIEWKFTYFISQFSHFLFTIYYILSVVQSPEHQDLAKTIASKSLVLLKNFALPLKKKYEKAAVRLNSLFFSNSELSC